MSERLDVSWWLGRGPAPDDFRDLFVEPFNEAHDDIRLQLTVLTESPLEQTVRALEDGAGPDVLMVPRAGDFRSLVKASHLADLSGYADRHGWTDRILDPVRRLATYGDRLYGLPRSSETLFLLSNRDVLDELDAPPPRSLAELEAVARQAVSVGIDPFSAGCVDLPASSEFLWTLAINHYAGPQLVRGALRGEVPWTSGVFVEALELLVSWFDRGWFGTAYFSQTIDAGLQRLTDGSAAMAPAMTGILPADDSGLVATPFPSLRAGLPTTIYVLGTASIVGINAASRHVEAAAEVLDAVFSTEVRRSFSARVPGDWNIPLVDADAAALRSVAPPSFVTAAVGLTEAVRDGRHGYATWSYFPPQSEALVTRQMQPLVEGTLAVRDHLAELEALFDQERRTRSTLDESVAASLD